MNKANKYMKTSFLCNLFLSIFKLIFGIVYNVRSLIADGIHSFSDLVTDIVAIVGTKISEKPADYSHPRGHGKVEYITGVIISLFIVFLSYEIFKSSFNGNETPNKYLIIVVSVTIIIKYLLSKYLITRGKKINSMILISSGKESLTDVLSSIVVLIAIVFSQFSNMFSIFKYSDIIASVIISILIFIMGIRVLFTNVSLLIGEGERSIEKNKKLEKIINKREDKFILKDYVMYKLGSYYEVVIVIMVDGDMTVRDGHKLMDDIENDLLKSKLNIKYVTIHIEPM